MKLYGEKKWISWKCVCRMCQYDPKQKKEKAVRRKRARREGKKQCLVV